MEEILSCKFCDATFKKGWDSKLARSGMDQLIIHCRNKHMREWGKIKVYSESTTKTREMQYAKQTGAYVQDQD